jgi:hypothetical protein
MSHGNTTSPARITARAQSSAKTSSGAASTVPDWSTRLAVAP